MSVVFFCFAPRFAVLFSEDEAVVRMMVRYLRITVWGFAFIEIHRYSSFFFTGVGRAKSGAALNILRVVGLMVPLTLVAALCFHSLDGVFYARLAADVGAGMTGCVLAARLTKRLMRAPAEA